MYFREAEEGQSQAENSVSNDLQLLVGSGIGEVVLCYKWQRMKGIGVRSTSQETSEGQRWKEGRKQPNWQGAVSKSSN